LVAGLVRPGGGQSDWSSLTLRLRLTAGASGGGRQPAPRAWVLLYLGRYGGV